MVSIPKSTASCTCRAVVAFTTSEGYPSSEQGSLGSGRQVSLFQLFHNVDTGSNLSAIVSLLLFIYTPSLKRGARFSYVWNSWPSHAFVIASQASLLNSGLLAWQTAAGGVGLNNRPSNVLLSLFHDSCDGHLDEPGTALHVVAAPKEERLSSITAVTANVDFMV